MSYPTTIRRCQHIKVNGTQCGSPALRDERRCYFHEQWRQTGEDMVACKSPSDFVLPTLEDANSIQMGLAQVMRLLRMEMVDHRTAALLLRALRTAVANVKNTSLEPQQPTQVVIDPKCVENRPLGATAWSAVEGKEYDEDTTSVNGGKQKEEEDEKTREEREFMAHWQHVVLGVARDKDFLDKPDTYAGYKPESVDQVSR
jgi:hypothetical protein